MQDRRNEINVDRSCQSQAMSGVAEHRYAYRPLPVVVSAGLSLALALHGCRQFVDLVALSSPLLVVQE